MKKKLFSYLKNNIPVGLRDQDIIQYYEFVNTNKIPFVNKCTTDYKIIKFPIILKWFNKIVQNYDNHNIIIKYI